jgi:hypothetical protein
VTNADERKIPIVFWILLAVFAAVNGVLIWQEFFWLPALPALIGVVLLAVLSLDQFVILIAFLTPLSVNLEDEGVGVALSLPSEPMIITAMMLFVIKFLMDGKYDFRILKHPIAIAVIIQIIWMFMTSVSSSLPIVSFKFLISRIWFVLTFFFLGVEVFRRRENIFRFVWAHIFGLLCVIVYTTYVHWTWAFEKDPAHWVMSPFDDWVICQFDVMMTSIWINENANANNAGLVWTLIKFCQQKNGYSARDAECLALLTVGIRREGSRSDSEARRSPVYAPLPLSLSDPGLVLSLLPSINKKWNANAKKVTEACVSKISSFKADSNRIPNRT